MTPQQARDDFILPALQHIGLHTPDAERLLMGTAAIESNFINFVQFGDGPARGMFQMEPPTFDDLTTRILGAASHAALGAKVAELAAPDQPGFLLLQTNHKLAAAMARVKYFSIPAAIPSTLAGQANYWWRFYNGMSPHGLKPQDYLDRWGQYCHALYPDFA
jgi:hypothetical protein